jgi:hypothetical protein
VRPCLKKRTLYLRSPIGTLGWSREGREEEDLKESKKKGRKEKLLNHYFYHYGNFDHTKSIVSLSSYVWPLCQMLQIQMSSTSPTRKI